MRFLIYPNKTYDDAVAFAAQITKKLTDLGHECYEMTSDTDPRLQQTDMGIIVGGDGTVLRLVRSLLSYQFPFWAVNYGHLGYLTECEPDEAFDALDRILHGQSKEQDGCQNTGGPMLFHRTLPRFCQSTACHSMPCGECICRFLLRQRKNASAVWRRRF